LKFSLYIAKRYLFSGSKNNAINIITGIASVGIIVGTTALFVVLSVFSGLKDFSLSFANDFDPDLKATAKTGKSFLISNEQINSLNTLNGIASYSKIIEERALFTFNGKDQLAYIKGVDANFNQVNQIEKTIFQGEWFEQETQNVVVGYGIAQKLSLVLFDMVNLLEIFVPKSGKGNINLPNDAFKNTIIVPSGVYFINEELNQKYVFASADLVQDLLDYKYNQFSGIEIKLKANANYNDVVNELNTVFKNNLIVKNRAQLNESLYKMLNTENLVLYLIFSLVISVTLFTLIGALTMIIIEKKSNLKTLFNLGTDIKSLKRIFLYQGFIICILGGFIGLVLGVINVLIQQHFSLVMINASMPYPVILNASNVILVIVTITILGFIASYIASSRVTKKLLE